MNDQRLPPDVERLLDSERGAAGAEPEVRDRVWRRLQAAIAAGGQAPVDAGARPAGLSRVARSKLAAALVTGALVAAGGWLASRSIMPRRPSGAPAVSAAPGPTAPPRPTTPAAAEPAPPPRDTAPAPALAPAHAHRHAATAEHDAPTRDAAGDRRAEHSLLEEARASLQAGDIGRAERALARHASSFPRGSLNEERDALRVRLSVAQHDPAGARAALDTFEHQHPDSLFLPSLRALVEASQ